MTKEEEQLEILIYKVSASVKKYAAVHKHLAKQTGTGFWGFYKKIDFTAIFSVSGSLFREIILKLNEVREFKDNSYKTLSNKDRIICDTLEEFTVSMLETTKSLLKLTYDLSETSKGKSGKKKLTLEENKENFLLYEKARAEQMKIGGKLNKLYGKI